jgi:hypothetical protein
MENPDAYMWLSCWVERSLRGRRVNALLLRMQRHQEDIEGGAPPDDGVALEKLQSRGCLAAARCARCGWRTRGPTGLTRWYSSAYADYTVRGVGRDPRVRR